ncbi:MAG TPA: carbon-nitrogen hydrolase family protein [Gammaproteobacteria bacterium]|nr:carbon-nitrogen hydrolase family protein [Gammaproteobacteria bacterium]
MTSCRAAAVQMNSGDDVSTNLRDAGRLMAQAAAQGAELIVLPENFALMARNDEARVRAGEVDGSGQIQDFLADKAQSLRVWIVGGTVPVVAGDDRVYARCPVYDAQGRRVAYYDKLHLFDVSVNAAGESYHESARMQSGDRAVLVDTPFGKLGLAVCYDLRFPELFRVLAVQGATLFAVPSAFTHSTGRVHWELLNRARAVENLAFVIAAAQTGRHANGRDTWGHSLIVEPWGEILAERAAEPGVVMARLDGDAQHALRERFPALRHRRLP